MEVEPEFFRGIAGARLSAVGFAKQQYSPMLTCHAVCPEGDEPEGTNRQTEQVVKKRARKPKFVFHQAFGNRSYSLSRFEIDCQKIPLPKLSKTKSLV